MARARKKKKSLCYELCGRPLSAKGWESVELGKIKIFKACYVDLNWFKPKGAGGNA
jgi:hypothetical protein